MENKILLERRRMTDYVVSHESLRGGSITFNGARNGKPTRKEISEEVFDYLVNQTTCFKKGKLYIVEEDVREEVGEEKLLNNSHTKEEAEKILMSATNSMKKKLSEIEEKSEKTFFLEVAKELHEQDKFDSSAKRNFIVEWAGIRKEMIDEIFVEKE